ncbi:MAG: hypothetical protein ACKO5K_13975 [Armatimonadota bacterium]
MTTPTYRILTVLLVAGFVLAWAAAWLGWFARPGAVTLAQRNAVRSHSVRIGSRYMGGGPHFGK